tara:strand:+ start:1509 stop:1685 length:177 start_codon:yes stop_codon:yes gene_type:complete
MKQATIHHQRVTLADIQMQIDALPSYEHARQYGEKAVVELHKQIKRLIERRNAILGRQ